MDRRKPGDVFDYARPGTPARRGDFTTGQVLVAGAAALAMVAALGAFFWWMAAGR